MIKTFGLLRFESPEGKFWTDDLNWQKLEPVQTNPVQQLPPTLTSAATIAPTTRFSFVTGTVPVATITPPVTGYHELIFCFNSAGPGIFLTTGNIQIAYQPVVNRPIALYYDPSTAKYWVGAVV